MPLDPSIIGSYNPGAAPDVNAMMTQQMQGMANINTMELQRKADALAMEDREAAALTRALAPAMAAAFSDPSDAGLDAALSLVPEQYRDSMAAQVSQLRGIRDPNRRKDVMRSALLQDEIGQALLAQLEPTANARLNADMAAQRAALDARRLQLEENKLAQGEGVSPDVAARLEFEREKLAAEKAAPPKQGEITQAERRAASLLNNVVRNAGAVNTVITGTPEAFQPTAVEAASGFLPWGERQVAAWQQTPERKIVYNRMLQSIDALLTLATGAAYTKPQLEAQLGAYLPGFFDEDAVKRDKVMALRDRIESEKINAGRAWTAEREAEAEEVFRQFETLADTMSSGAFAPRGPAGGEGDVDTNNPLLQEP